MVSGTFTATGQSAAFSPGYATIQFNVSLWGTFSATVRLERSFDGGTTWLPLTAMGSSFTYTAPMSEQFEEYEGSVQYRLNCTAFTSGTVNYRISQ